MNHKYEKDLLALTLKKKKQTRDRFIRLDVGIKFIRDMLGLTGNREGIAMDRPGIARDRPGISRDRPGISSDRPGIARERTGIVRDKWHNW